MKQQFILRTCVIALALIILMQISAFAYNITLNVYTDNSTYDVGKEVILTVKLSEKQQAAGFIVNYDSSKVKFVNSPDVADTFYNLKDDGKIDFNWASMDGKDLTQISFKFTTIAEGQAEFLITGAEKEKFSDAEVVCPEMVDVSNAKIKIIIAAPDDSKPADPTPSNPIQKPDDGKIEQKPTNGTINKVDNTVAEGKIPQTGVETTIIFVIGIVVLIGIIELKKYRNLSGI